MVQRLHAAGEFHREIAMTLGRSESGVYHALRRLKGSGMALAASDSHANGLLVVQQPVGDDRGS